MQPAVSGIKPAERAAARTKRVAPGRETRSRDEDDQVSVTDAGERVRGLEGNDQESAHEDRQAHEQYTPGGNVKPKTTQRTLDIEG